MYQILRAAWLVGITHGYLIIRISEHLDGGTSCFHAEVMQFWWSAAGLWLVSKELHNKTKQTFMHAVSDLGSKGTLCNINLNFIKQLRPRVHRTHWSNVLSMTWKITIESISFSKQPYKKNYTLDKKNWNQRKLCQQVIPNLLFFY